MAAYVSSKERYRVSTINFDNNYVFEHLWLKISINKQNFAIGIIYRPPDKNLATCIEQLDEMLSNIIPTVDHVIVCGDVNVNLFNQNNLLTKCFDAYNFKQLINEATRITASTQTLLDPIFVSDSSIVLAQGTVNADFISDHCLVFCNIKSSAPKCKQKIITIRDFKNFNLTDFQYDLTNTALNDILYLPNINAKVEYLTNAILSLFNNHAPLRTIRVSKPKAPWLTDTLKIMMRERDKALDKYKITKSDQHWNNYKMLRNYTLASVRREKKAYLCALFRDGNAKMGWKGLKALGLQSNKNSELPAHLVDLEELNNYFSSFVNSNSNNDCTDKTNFYNTHSHPANKTFQFNLISPEEIQIIVDSFTSNAFGDDGLSLKMLQYCLPFISPYIAHIINSCLEQGYFPNDWKMALVQPIPKTKCPTSVTDLRPISILPILSKILEKIIHKQLNDFVTVNNMLPECQSRFRRAHSTTSALLNVTDDIFHALDKKQLAVLVLLDFSKAFDTVNHALMIAKLKYIGCDNTAINLFISYFSNRKQKIIINGNTSTVSNITSGVPQGSVLGPLLFIIYTSDLFCEIKHCKIQGYADDTQIYGDFNIKDVLEFTEKINADLQAVYDFSTSHNLILNANKTKFMVFGNSKHIETVLPNLKLNINNDMLPYTTKHKNLGLTFDTQLRFVDHVNSLLCKSYSTLKLLYSNKHVLSFNLRKMLCESLVLSVFNYADFVYGPCVDSITRNRIQKVQNTCCRLVFGLRKFDRISDKLKILNWLPMNKIWELHLLNFVHQLLLRGQPSYLRAKVSSRCNLHSVNVRSSSNLSIPRHTTSVFHRSFSYNSVKIYNQVDNELKN